MSLAPGDLAVIESVVGIPLEARHAIGQTVILIAACTHPHDARLSPFWRCSGVPSDWCISHVVLRKIPPAPMEREIPDLMEMVR